MEIIGGISIAGAFSFIPLFLQELDTGLLSREVWAGLIVGIASFTTAFSNPYWGAYGDRKGHKKLLIQILIALTVLFALMSGVQSAWQLFLLRAIQGAVGGFIAAGMALVATGTPAEFTPAALGKVQMGVILGNSIGPMLGGVVADWLGFRRVFWFFAFLTALGGWLVLSRVKVEKQNNESKEVLSVWQHLRTLWQIPLVRLMMAAQFLVGFGLTGLAPILPLYIQQMVGEQGPVATVSGVILALGGVAGAIAAGMTGRLANHLGNRKVLYGAAAVAGVVFLLQYWAPNIWWLGFWRLVDGFFIGLLMPTSNAVISQSVPASQRGVAFGATSSVNLIGNVVGPLVSGVVAATWGLASVFWLSALVFIAVAVTIYRSFPVKQIINGEV